MLMVHRHRKCYYYRSNFHHNPANGYKWEGFNQQTQMDMDMDVNECTRTRRLTGTTTLKQVGIIPSMVTRKMQTKKEISTNSPPPR